MADFMITLDDIANFSAGGGKRVQQPGLWSGKISEVVMKPLPDHNGMPFKGYETTDGEILTVYLRDQTPLQDQESMGESPFFYDIVLRDGPRDIFDTNPRDRDLGCWQLQRSIMSLLNFAQALGQLEVDPVTGGVQLAAGFIEALRDGDFEGYEVQYVIGHRKGKGENKGPFPFLQNFVVAEDDDG